MLVSWSIILYLCLNRSCLCAPYDHRPASVQENLLRYNSLTFWTYAEIINTSIIYADNIKFLYKIFRKDPLEDTYNRLSLIRTDISCFGWEMTQQIFH